MNQDLANHRARAGKMQLFFGDKSSLITPLTDVNQDVTDVNGMISDFDLEAQAQDTIITGFATEKESKLDAAANVTSKWGRRCHVKAHKDGNFSLENILNHRAYEIKHLDDANGLQMMKNIRKGLNDNLGAFTVQGLTGGIIADMDTKIAAYEAVLNLPENKIDTRKTETGLLDSMMADIDSKLTDIVDTLEAEWEDTHPDELAEMKNQFLIDNVGHRGNNMEGVISSQQGQGQAGYTVTVIPERKPNSKRRVTNKTATTDLMGHYKVKGIVSGLATVEVRNAQGTLVRSQVETILKGQTLQRSWQF